jgi:hypothetical protein
MRALFLEQVMDADERDRLYERLRRPLPSSDRAAVVTLEQ